MKTKTATINVYHMFGTARTTVAQVLYRGKPLHSIIDTDTPNNLLAQARAWALSRGFTRTRVIYG